MSLALESWHGFIFYHIKLSIINCVISFGLVSPSMKIRLLVYVKHAYLLFI